jgi:hypothetical protein
MSPVDPFTVFRTALFAGVAAYTLLTAASTIWRVAVVLRGNDPRARLLRTYLSYQLVSVRLRPLAGELLEVTSWLAVLLGLCWLHGHV